MWRFLVWLKKCAFGAFTIWHNPQVVLLILSSSLLISVLSVQRAMFVLLACMCRGMPPVSLRACMASFVIKKNDVDVSVSPYIAQFPSCFYLCCLKVVSLS